VSKSKKFLASLLHGDERYRIEYDQIFVDASNHLIAYLTMSIHFELKYCVMAGLLHRHALPYKH
jgi:hypothetical protein